MLSSNFQAGSANGEGCYEDTEEGIRRHGTFVHGDLEGFGWESDEDGDVLAMKKAMKKAMSSAMKNAKK